MSELTGKTALVTGGGTGIGFGCAKELVAAGASVTNASRRSEVLEQAAASLGPDARTVVCDITQESQVEEAVGVAARDGNLDILVANAGAGSLGALLQMSSTDWNQCLGLNVTGTALCMKQAALIMKEHGGGRIVAISSAAGANVSPWLSAYASSKAALDMLVRCAAVELANHRIRVNSIQPGHIDVPSAPMPGEMLETMRKATPLGRLGSPEDIGYAVRFLASDAADWVTGQNFAVDGGLTIPWMTSLGTVAEMVYGRDVVSDLAIPDMVNVAKRV